VFQLVLSLDLDANASYVPFIREENVVLMRGYNISDNTTLGKLHRLVSISLYQCESFEASCLNRA